MLRFVFLTLMAFQFILSGCSTSENSSERRFAIDPMWNSLSLKGRESNLTGFATDLLQEIGRVEKINFVKVSVSWDQLIPGLMNKDVEAILISMSPYNFNQNQFDFSDLFLNTGPVLVVPSSSRVSALNQLDGKEIAAISGTSGALILEKYPGILIRNYDSIPQALNAIVKGDIDGALVDILTATAYLQDIYHGSLKIATPTLNDSGLRMVSLHNAAPDLIEGFNEGLEKLKSNGTYDKLLKKWSLTTEQTNS
jgi:polar amino acid transport system substrate-binding protein